MKRLIEEDVNFIVVTRYCPECDEVDCTNTEGHNLLRVSPVQGFETKEQAKNWVLSQPNGDGIHNKGHWEIVERVVGRTEVFNILSWLWKQT